MFVFTSGEKDNNSFPQTPPTPTLVPPGFFEQEAGNAPPDTKPVCPTPNPPLLACKEKEQYERRGSGAGTSASCSEMPPLGVALPTNQTLPIFVAHRHSQRAHSQSDWQCCISRFVKSRSFFLQILFLNRIGMIHCHSNLILQAALDL